MTAPITAIKRLQQIRKIAGSIECEEGGELWSLIANIEGACDLAVEEVHARVARYPSSRNPLGANSA